MRWWVGPRPQTSDSPGWSGAVSDSLASATTRSRREAPVSARRSLASSSPTIGSCGNVRERIVFTTACAAKSPTANTEVQYPF